MKKIDAIRLTLLVLTLALIGMALESPDDIDWSNGNAARL